MAILAAVLKNDLDVLVESDVPSEPSSARKYNNDRKALGHTSIVYQLNVAEQIGIRERLGSQQAKQWRVREPR
jgi:hypothetical protein